MNKKQEETNLGRPPSYYYCTWVLNVRHVAAALGPESVLTKSNPK